MAINDELEVYATQTTWLLGEIIANLEVASAETRSRVPTALRDGNNLLAIAKHVAGVTRAYALGMGCGLRVHRDRSAEFSAPGGDADAILADLRSLLVEVPRAFESIGQAQLDRRFVPERSLYGTGEPREMSGRLAIVENIRHMGIHLGEMRLTRSLLEND